MTYNWQAITHTGSRLTPDPAWSFISGPVATFSPTTEPATSAAGNVVVDFTDVHQRIDGFGAADVWVGALTDAQADLFFSPTNGIGLSILRQGIDNSGSSLSALSNATKAAARGAIVWAAPWTAPAAWKDNGTTNNGGHLLPADYDAWATRLTTYATTMQQAGVPLYALSVQNEPDYTASYDSMLYTNLEMENFVKVLGPKLATLNPRPKLMMPEFQLGGAWGSGAVLGDSTAALPDHRCASMPACRRANHGTADLGDRTIQL